jgi:hypothetical protein
MLIVRILVTALLWDQRRRPSALSPPVCVCVCVCVWIKFAFMELTRLRVGDCLPRQMITGSGFNPITQQKLREALDSFKGSSLNKGASLDSVR